MKRLQSGNGFLSIGELSRQTGIACSTLRIWEKRYGRPSAHRLPSGHRRYTKDEVTRLKAIAQALDLGYRASKVVCCTLEELHQLLQPESRNSSRVWQTTSPLQDNPASDTSIIDNWLSATKGFDESGLSQSFHEQWATRGPLGFIRELGAGFVRKLGCAWEEGEISISQEHFASERLEHFLSSRWRALNERKEGPNVLLTTLPGDAHRLGLQMCAAITALTNVRIIYLGPDTPLDDIVHAADTERIQGIAISIASTMAPQQVIEYTLNLRRRLPADIAIATGGAGSVGGFPGIHRFDNFDVYYQWLSGPFMKNLGNFFPGKS